MDRFKLRYDWFVNGLWQPKRRHEGLLSKPHKQITPDLFSAPLKTRPTIAVRASAVARDTAFGLAATFNNLKSRVLPHFRSLSMGNTSRRLLNSGLQFAKPKKLSQAFAS